MFDLTPTQMVSAYIFLGVIHAICMLRVSGGVSEPAEAFWMTFLLILVFPAAAAYSLYWILSNTLFLAIGDKNHREAEARQREVLRNYDAEQKAKENVDIGDSLGGGVGGGGSGYA